MRISVFLALDTPLHPRSWHGPQGIVEIKLRPSGTPKLVRTLEEHRSQLQSRTHDVPALIRSDNAD